MPTNSSFAVLMKRFLSQHLTPEETWRGRLKQIVTDFLRNPRVREAGPEPLPIFDRKALAAMLPDPLCLFEADATLAETDACGAARFILALLRDRADLRTRFPRALSDGLESPFCMWLAAEMPTAALHIRAAFALRLGATVRLLYAQRPELRRLFPLGLLPGGRRRFLWWLLRHGDKHGLSVEAIWWFLYEAAEDPGTMLAETYLQQPGWQYAVPHGLTPAGQPRLRAWLRRKYRIQSAWLDEAMIPPRTSNSSATFGINVLGHFAYPSGLQELALAAVKAAEAAGIAVSARDVPAGPGKDMLDRAEYLGLEDHSVTLFYFGSEPPVPVCYNRAGLAPRRDMHRVVAWSWELEEVPRSFARNARHAHEFWAHTRFIADAMRKVLPIPVVHMLPGVELQPFAPRPRSHFGLPEDRCLFLFAFDMNSVMERKNPLGLIRAFRKAFGSNDRAALAIKVSRGDSDPGSLRRLTSAAKEAGVHLIDRVMSRDECSALMNCCDCYVSLHRSEGFGFTMAEAMLLNKPVVATAYSGNLDFMTQDNSLLVGCRRVPLQETIGVYPKGCLWAEPNIDEAALHLRWVYEHREEAQELGKKGQREASELLSFRAAGARMRARLEAIRAAKST